MSDGNRRKELQAQYKESRSEAGVYRIVNRQTNKALVGSSPDLASVRNRLEFAKSTNTPGALDRRLRGDIGESGLDALSLEILEVLEMTPEMTRAEILEDLSTLEELWREKFDPSVLY